MKNIGRSITLGLLAAGLIATAVSLIKSGYPSETWGWLFFFAFLCIVGILNE